MTIFKAKRNQKGTQQGENIATRTKMTRTKWDPFQDVTAHSKDLLAGPMRNEDDCMLSAIKTAACNLSDFHWCSKRCSLSCYC